MEHNRFTPGPWHISLVGVGFEVEALVDGKTTIVAQAKQLRRNDRETYHCERTANARLICAAPDLLEALQVIIAVASGAEQVVPDDTAGMEWIDKFARAAIAKAKGEPHE